MENPCITYNIQDSFSTEGYFSIQEIPLGSNLYLVKEKKKGKIKAMVDEGSDWLR